MENNIKSDKNQESYELGNQEHELEDKLEHLSLKNRSSYVLKYLADVVDSKLTHINFGYIMSLYPDEPDFPYKVLQLIKTKAVNLNEFFIQGIKLDFFSPNIEETIRLEIGKLTGLRRLEVTRFYFEMDDLRVMCCGLKHLTYLEVKIKLDINYFDDEKERNLPKLFRQSFGHLKYFYFAAVGAYAENFQQMLTKFCIKHLLCLQGVGLKDVFIDMTLLCKSMSKTSQMRQLMLEMDKFEEEECKLDNFPYIDCLFIEWSNGYAYRPIEKTKLHLLRNFKYVNSLMFSNLKYLDYLKFLIQAYGKRLVNLTINMLRSGKRKMFDFKLIQKLIPNLHKLRLLHIKISPKDSPSLRDFSKLKEINIVFYLDSSEIICLSDFISPPALEALYLMQMKVSRRELQNTVDKIKRKEISGSIKYFHLFVIVDGGEKVKKIIHEKCSELVQELCKIKPTVIPTIQIGSMPEIYKKP